MDRIRPSIVALMLAGLTSAAPVARAQDTLRRVCFPTNPPTCSPSLDTAAARRAFRPDSGRPYFEFQVDKPVREIPGSPAPKYPPTLKAAAVEGAVLAQFVVDTNGVVEPKSLRVLKSTHPSFTTAVLDAVPAMRFEPAVAHGAKVRQLVQRPFVFAISGGPGPNLDSILGRGRADRPVRPPTGFQLPGSRVAGPPPTGRLNGWTVTLRSTVDSGAGRTHATSVNYTGAGKRLRMVVEREGAPSPMSSMVMLWHADSGTFTSLIALTQSAIVGVRPASAAPSGLPHYDRHVTTVVDTLGQDDVLGYHTLHLRATTQGTITGSWNGVSCTGPLRSEVDTWVTSDSAAVAVLHQYQLSQASITARASLPEALDTVRSAKGGAVTVRSRYSRTLVSPSGVPATVMTTIDLVGARALEVSEADFAVPEGYRVIDTQLSGRTVTTTDSLRRVESERILMAQFDTSVTAPADRRATCTRQP